MRVVIQKVTRASVTVENSVVSAINKGLMVLVGISTKDTSDDVDRMVKKLANLRLFEDMAAAPEGMGCWAGKPWAKSLAHDKELSVLSVSQFTLYGTVKKGTKPDFHRAAKGQVAVDLYTEFLEKLRKELGDEERVKDGQFGAMMDVELVNEGPVTIVWDTSDIGF
ncbi:hypothetical protein FT663_04361 [Candidozyma haemuli var. vulneris]|uniref:D-aminoacyl-tRNA deacylase n=1 Tax=Candidozyma haemuli TaxID=45357 RepID=A0A2V1AT19_9ASCO|nr:D-tyrosyl-tRNA(Tyr) deacylase [[Candida] haemuloni]KAF3987646.1 hypothetical protein FT663_04361 [[Candida] haemuloni var. vulneris]KAF3991314.1 hypothetical protein FT662_01769 [[Candida] haemuloni var. vulneris]PVH20978.1 D-tyrosyl-tRNA(Tyr) deacylase [[Candida] haemuloni]